MSAAGGQAMSSTRPVETVLCSQDLPLEFRHRSSAHEGDERKVASRLSGIVPARQLDEVICPYLLRRNLLVPARGAARRHFPERSASGYSESCAPRVPPDA